MTKNIELDVVVSTVKVLFQFHIIFRIRQNKMFIDLLSESCEEREEFLCWVTKMSQYFEDKFVQMSLNFWLSFTSYFS